MKKILLMITMVLMVGLSGCVVYDDCGHHDRHPAHHGASHGGSHGPHHRGGHAYSGHHR